MKVGDEVIYIDDDGREIPAQVEFVVPPAVDPVASPNFDLSGFNAGLIGGGVRDEESYLISIFGKDYRDAAPRLERQLLWPKVSRICIPITSMPKTNGRKRTKK